MVQDTDLPEYCPSCRTEEFVGRKTAPASYDAQSEDMEVQVSKLSWLDAECENCGKQIVVDGELIVEIDDPISIERDESESRLDEFARTETHSD